MTITADGTIIPETAAERAASGRETYARALTYRLAIKGSPDIVTALADLLDALETWDALAGGIHPGAYWQELEHDDEAFPRGLEWAAGSIAEREAELVRLFPACEAERVIREAAVSGEGRAS
jgi:hypothetical protein